MAHRRHLWSPESCRLVHLVVDAADPAGLARFWSGALAWPVTFEEPDEVVIEPPDDDPAQAGQVPLDARLLVPQRPAAAAPSWHQVGHPPRPTSTASPTSTGLPTGGRNRVERSVGRLKQFRRVATRYDKRARNYLAWATLAAAVIWL